MAQHLAEIANVSLHAQSDSTNDLTFAKLLYDCGNEFLGIREYLLDVAMTLSLICIGLNAPSISLDSAYAGNSDNDNTTEFVHDTVVIKDDPPSVLNVQRLNRLNQWQSLVHILEC